MALLVLPNQLQPVLIRVSSSAAVQRIIVAGTLHLAERIALPVQFAGKRIALRQLLRLPRQIQLAEALALR